MLRRSLFLFAALTICLPSLHAAETEASATIAMQACQAQWDACVNHLTEFYSVETSLESDIQYLDSFGGTYSQDALSFSATLVQLEADWTEDDFWVDYNIGADGAEQAQEEFDNEDWDACVTYAGTGQQGFADAKGPMASYVTMIHAIEDAVADKIEEAENLY